MQRMNTTESNPAAVSQRRRLVVVIATAAAVVLLAEWGSAWLLSDAGALPDATPSTQRPENVTIIAKDPAALPAPQPDPSVWLLGNSHTYALPGLQRGQPLRPSQSGTIIDELADRFGSYHPQANVEFYQLAYPNFLPFEMLTRVGHLLYEKHRPTVVILGLTWRNIARDSQLRYEIYEVYRDAAFCDAFEQMLRDPRVDAPPDVLEAIRTQRRRVEHDEEQERMKSDSDKIDEVLTNWASDHVTLMDKSADLRAQIFRTMTTRVQRMWRDPEGNEYTYDLVDHDYAFNLECLRTLLRLLKDHGATVICYFAPERSDLALLMDPRRQDEFIALFSRETEQLGIPLLDARKVVPNEYWGWVGDTPDRSHFTEPGHQRLGRFLYEQIGPSTWEKLAVP